MQRWQRARAVNVTFGMDQDACQCEIVRLFSHVFTLLCMTLLGQSIASCGTGSGSVHPHETLVAVISRGLAAVEP